MSDLAKGPASGFLFQFEIALLELSKLEANQSISIEKIDDIGKEDDKGTFICTIQAKHSISLSGANFGTTSTDLWKTVINWIDKIKLNVLNDSNEFVAVTNKKIPANSIVRDFQKVSFKVLVQKIDDLKNQQQVAYDKKYKLNPKNGKTLKATISRLEKIVKHDKEFEIIVKNFKFIEGINAKEEFLNKTFLNSVKSIDKKNEIYQRFYGWICETSFENWKDGKEAHFSKIQFDQKYLFIINNHSLVEGIFRTKKQLLDNETIDIHSIAKNELFIKQIEDIERPFKDEIIRNAVLDFIMFDLEMTYLITSKSGTILTKLDFEEFQDNCEEQWNTIKKLHIRKSLDKYSDEEIVEICCCIYDDIMTKIVVDFQNEYSFNATNRYIQNGTFLRLSNIPKIGWHPDWAAKYKKP